MNLQEQKYRIKQIMGILKEESNKSDAEKELDDFNNTEDKVKSSHISRKKVLSWYNRMKEKYPLLKIRIQVDGDLLRAEAEIDKNRITCEECGWSWKLSEGGDDPYTCHKCGHTNN